MAKSLNGQVYYQVYSKGKMLDCGLNFIDMHFFYCTLPVESRVMYRVEKNGSRKIIHPEKGEK